MPSPSVAVLAVPPVVEITDIPDPNGIVEVEVNVKAKAEALRDPWMARPTTFGLKLNEHEEKASQRQRNEREPNQPQERTQAFSSGKSKETAPQRTRPKSNSRRLGEV